MTAPEKEVTIVSWNVLLDKTRTAQGLVEAQSKRLSSQIQTLAELPIPLDVVLIQEAQETKQAHHGETMARSLGFAAGYWHEHNTSKRRGEHIGLFGAEVSNAEFFDVGHDKLAVLSMIGELAVVGIHHRNENFGPMRADQMAAVLERLAPFEAAVIAGDTNALWFEKSRRMVRSSGFRSAFHMAGQRRPGTYPSPSYRGVMYGPLKQRLAPRLVSLDDIYVRGVDVTDADTFVGDSDHVGLWATVAAS
jgi:hypothetical protein